VLLVGDAAHLNNPLGGFGMNSGIHDAWNLTEKLIQILRHGGDADALLARFDRQRRTITNDFVQAQTKRNKAAMESEDQQRAFEANLAAVLADDGRRRDYLLEQSMIKSLEREAAID
jgi:3-(3-hydroxy-phenyl)propionate hydroxylase